MNLPSHGGKRKGAGRKPKNGVEAGVSHAARPQFKARHGLPEHNIETNKATYLLANSTITGPSPDRDGSVRPRKVRRGESVGG